MVEAGPDVAPVRGSVVRILCCPCLTAKRRKTLSPATERETGEKRSPTRNSQEKKSEYFVTQKVASNPKSMYRLCGAPLSGLAYRGGNRE